MLKIAVINRCVLFLLLSLTIIVQSRSAPTSTQHHHNSKFYWYEKNHQLLMNRMSNFQLEQLPRVKNVIIFIGDGMGGTTITASRMLKRQSTKNLNAHLTFDEFPATAIMQTDIFNSQIPESAASSTALFCGVKTNFENLGVDASAGRNACSKIDSHVDSILSWAQEKNIKTGFVTTSRVTHATPAALYAHGRRHMEDDSKLDNDECKDIARQLIENRPGKDFKVIMGGGMSRLVSDEMCDYGRRKDGRNLTENWLELHPRGKFVTTRDELLRVDQNTEHLLGIFAKSHMQFNADRNASIEPSLAEMTESAIKVLKAKNSRGFMLMVEAAKIDLAHHYNNAFRALDDTLAFDEAIKTALENIDLSDTLVIVTADHASAMVYSGFATPKNYSVLGFDKYVSNVDSKAYQLLLYSSGIGYSNYSQTASLHDHKNSIHKATIPSTWSNHAASDVPLYAIGPMANLLFSGTFDHTYLPHAIAFSMCLFQYSSRCDDAFIQRSRPMNEKKSGGLDELKKVLSKESKKFQNNFEDLERRLKEENEELSDVENSLNSDTFESSDLKGNFTHNENSSTRAKFNFLSILFFCAIKFLIQ